MKQNFLKMSLAAALTLTGAAAVLPQKMVNAATTKEPVKRVQINCSPNKNVKVWTSYEGGQLVNFRAQNKSTWNVAETAVDHKGKLWYKIGYSEWIEARYATDLEKVDSKTANEQVNPAPVKTKPKKVAKKDKIQTKNAKPTKNQPQQLATVSNKKATSKSGVKKWANVIKPVAANATASTSAAKRAQAVVNLAKTQVGKGYAWGGNGPDNFDCSGLVQYIYNQVGGVKLPRVTTDQVKVGTTVPMDQLQPGDLLYWGTADAPYHVGIYIGNNQYINAATPDDGVVLSTISSYFYPCVAKRVIQ